ncbi:acetolactate decarboxylase [Commensalibacter oyaizuii]|uniref:Alpha-acetolactate decarboxylase n=1 Tax=Commensalibacter oyaizuii TaxID=3043873 RepID=A0ABT6Q347_9PROT|nr:acetolactate decarboxylase [Commensalibacter sp. TBRC 16381]MDI2091527.1 acetolactate decarboxylase [Commensalibacter sp. TBRC 16381]
MSKIIQFSTIGALMAGYLQGDRLFSQVCCGCNFGLGCSANLDGELTIYDGTAYEATAGHALQTLDFESKVPFIQITNFQPEQSHIIKDVDHTTIYNSMKRFIQFDNILLAVSVQGTFRKVIVRRPHSSYTGEDRDVSKIAASQQVDTYCQVKGTLIGFWTPELFGRISVPRFHFHFLDESKRKSGHVLEFDVEQAQLSFEEKPTLEITNPKKDQFKQMKIDINMLDEMINRVEK